MYSVAIKDHNCQRGNHTYCFGYFENSQTDIFNLTVDTVTSSVDFISGQVNQLFQIKYSRMKSVSIVSNHDIIYLAESITYIQGSEFEIGLSTLI